MKEPWEWTEEDIQPLIAEQRPEDLRLDYKRSDALAKADKQKGEIAKDVSAMANSAGGVLIYGIGEQKSTNGPIRLDAGVDASQISTEWLEQVIDSGVQRRIDGIRLNPVRMSSTGNLVYVVYVPQSNRAPHMASDGRYHKRLGTTTARMEEYEVRDVGRRLESPDLHLAIDFVNDGTGPNLILRPRISNSASEPALYATCRVYLEKRSLVPQLQPNFRWVDVGDAEMLWRDQKFLFRVVRLMWSVPEKHPILEDEEYAMDALPITIRGHELGLTRFYKIGWELRTPKALRKFRGLELADDNGMVRKISDERVLFGTL